MRKVERGELLDLVEYERIRDHFRKRVIEEKVHRRVVPSSEISAIFENRDTVLLQVQEMLRTERITKEEAIIHELETYNELVPGQDELSATMFVEIADAATRDRRLVELAGLEQHIALEVDGQLVRARNESRGILPGRTTAVHYVKFPLGPVLASRLRELAPARRADLVHWVLDHPALCVRAPLAPEAVASLAEDLAAK